MRDTWYADNRDLVKWGTLAFLAERENLEVLVQVPYLRGGDRRPLVLDGGQFPIQSAVWNFFRSVPSVAALGEHLGREVVVIADPFEPRQRDAYCRTVLGWIDNIQRSKAVLLDPDTGLAPSRAEAEHATPGEVEAIWRALRDGDWLVLYQHASRSKTWQTDGRRKFAATCGLDTCEIFTAPEIAWDVAFFAAKKTSGAESK